MKELQDQNKEVQSLLQNYAKPLSIIALEPKDAEI